MAARPEFVGGDKLVRRGRPRAERTKVALTARYDAAVVEAFRSTGKGWQTRMNAALRDWINATPQRRGGGRAGVKGALREERR